MPTASLSHVAMLGSVGIGMWVKRVLGLVLSLAICAGLWWLRPMPADPAVLAFLEQASAPATEPAPATDPEPGEGEESPAPAAEAPVDEAPAPTEGEAAEAPPLTVVQTRTLLEMYPTGTEPTRGLAFFQGARVDPRAYAKILRPIAEAGFLVSIAKSPYDLAIIDIGGVRPIVDRHPEVTWWAVGGHSLGGTAAATFAAGSPRTTPALVLWASYPFSSLASVNELSVLSVSGTADGLSTPADIEASRPNLPASTTFVAIEGANHSFFGDYGEQAGDGVATIPREEAQRQIVEATLQWLRGAAGVA